MTIASRDRCPKKWLLLFITSNYTKRATPQHILETVYDLIGENDASELSRTRQLVCSDLMFCTNVHNAMYPCPEVGLQKCRCSHHCKQLIFGSSVLDKIMRRLVLATTLYTGPLLLQRRLLWKCHRCKPSAARAYLCKCCRCKLVKGIANDRTAMWVQTIDMLQGRSHVLDVHRIAIIRKSCVWLVRSN